MNNKEIRFTGYAAAPSDYDCPDGQLAQSFNLLNETGSMRPLFPPKVLLSLEAGSEIAFMHKTSAFTHCIIRNDNSLYWCDSKLIDEVRQKVGDDSLYMIGSFNGFMQVSSVGNTLIVLYSGGICYILWKAQDNAYVNLGSKIPFPEISFALGRPLIGAAPESFDFSVEIPDSLKSYVSRQWFPSADSGVWRPVGPASRFMSPDLSALVRNVSSAVYAGLDKYIADAADDCQFTEPFFIRYALRLFDGSHIMHSAPVLMIPNSSAPILPYSPAPSDDDNLLAVTTRIVHAKCSLLFRIVKSGLTDWQDIVTHVDFFISSPIYTYEQSGDIQPKRISNNADPEKFSHMGVFSPRSVDSRTDGDSGHRHPVDPAANPLYAFPDGNCEEFQDPPPPGMVWNLGVRKASEIEEAVTNPQAALFYLVSSVDIGKMSAMEAFCLLDMEGRSLRNLQARPRLEDDYQSHHSLLPSLAHSYNSRLNLSGINLKPFIGFSIVSMSQYYRPRAAEPGNAVSNSSVIAYVKLRRNGSSVWVADMNARQQLPGKLSDEYFPRWLFYPDSSAVEMVIAEFEAMALKGYWRLSLSSHASLEGAYWFRGLGKDLPEYVSPNIENGPVRLPDELLAAYINATVPLNNKIYTSEVNNPFFFPATGVNTVGTGRILGICSAAKALSQGQFGQFPLYAFTDEGVWALEVSSSGGFSAKQPITRDVCLSADSITQIDSAVLFATDRGIMLISGSQTQCISDVLDSPDCFDLSRLPGLCAKFPEFRHPDCLFIDYIKNCRMAYDYVNQRIILFNPDKGYAYVYSMRTKLWGIQESSLTSAVNSYPHALAMAKGEDGNCLVDLSRTDAETARCLLVSRPLKFDSPDVLKTLAATIQRGLLPRQRGDVATALYGTRDYFCWRLVGSSRGPSLRSFRGSPYKAFRVVSVATLGRGDSIAGCSFDVLPRMTNRLR